MKKNIKISIIQSDIAWNDKKQNLYFFSNLINSIPETDLIILPELFDTAFVTDINILDKSNNEMTLDWMKQIAKNKQTTIAGSTYYKENNLFYNRFFFAKNNSEIDFYDKRHLFSIANENNITTQGKKRKIINLYNFKILPLVCYDLRFPVWSRNKNDYDLLIYVANWPTSRINQWKSLLIARAIENQCYTIGVNRIGKDGNGFEYCGNSLIVSPIGEIIYQAKTNEQDIFTTELDLEYLINIRNKFPVLIDGDNFEIKI